MRSLRMPPSRRPGEGGLISLLVHSTAASSLVFSDRKKQRYSVAGAKHCSLQAPLKLLSLEPSHLLLQWGLSFLPMRISSCYPGLWYISLHHSKEQTETRSHRPPWFCRLLSASFREMEKMWSPVAVWQHWRSCSGQLPPCSTLVIRRLIIGEEGWRKRRVKLCY